MIIGEKLFHCEICPLGFTESSDLSDHRGEQSGEKPFHCEICPLGFTESGDLSDHRGETNSL